LATKEKTQLVPPWADKKKNYKSNLWVLKKGKDYVKISKCEVNKTGFYLQKDQDRRLTIDSLQARLTFHQLIEYGYKLQN
tara:strand:- start:145 stop:384 length:240 start_codon:yes stop_codon:yes gene_type:complete